MSSNLKIWIFLHWFEFVLQLCVKKPRCCVSSFFPESIRKLQTLFALRFLWLVLNFIIILLPSLLLLSCGLFACWSFLALLLSCVAKLARICLWFCGVPIACCIFEHTKFASSIKATSIANTICNLECVIKKDLANLAEQFATQKLTPKVIICRAADAEVKVELKSDNQLDYNLIRRSKTHSIVAYYDTVFGAQSILRKTETRFKLELQLNFKFNFNRGGNDS